MSALYFAYGSNLKIARLRARVASARVVAPARLDEFRLGLDKRGGDGSGKANLIRASGARVWGVLYELAAGDWAALDRHEPGYARTRVRVLVEQRSLDSWTYVAQVLTDEAVAFDWYKRLILEGAREHGLPDDWLADLEGLPERPDPRSWTP